MRQLLTCCVRLIMIALCEYCFADGKAQMDSSKSKGENVKAALSASNQLSAVGVNIVRDCSEMNWRDFFGKWKYSLGISQDLLQIIGKYTIRSMEWNTNNKSHAEQLRLVVIIGENGGIDARDGLFEIMGMGTTMMITPSTYRIVKDGPGDLCVVMPGNLSKKDNLSRILHKVWFVRDNVGVELSCSGDTDLLPISKAVDQFIQSFPKR